MECTSSGPNGPPAAGPLTGLPRWTHGVGATMCYMGSDDSRVGVRELRQNLSKYLRRVVRGETLEVTERGRPVALLAPLPPGSSPLERLIASGRAVRPEDDLMALLPPEGPTSSVLSEALREERTERL